MSNQPKKVILTMDENNQFSINGNVPTIEVLGFLEYAKAILLRDAVPPMPKSEEPTIPVEEKRIESDGTSN